MKEKRKKVRWEENFQVAVVIVMLILVFVIMGQITGLERTARVINYTGLVRGATQRLVKLELVGQADPELEAQLDTWLSELASGSGEDNLAHLDDADYNQKLGDLTKRWQVLKGEIGTVRAGGDKTALINDSEIYFARANDLVSSAERYSRVESNRLRWLEYALLAVTAALVIDLVSRNVRSMRMERRIRELSTIAYADNTTHLPNRASCDAVVSGHADPADCARHGAIMFDLNNLKKTNDSYGHEAGDVLIAAFGTLLQETAEGVCFVGRWGGDEFVAIFDEGDEGRIAVFIDELDRKAGTYNQKNSLVQIDYAWGICQNTDEPVFNMAQMIAVADKNMYQMKTAMKAKGKTP